MGPTLDPSKQSFSTSIIRISFLLLTFFIFTFFFLSIRFCLQMLGPWRCLSFFFTVSSFLSFSFLVLSVVLSPIFPFPCFHILDFLQIKIYSLFFFFQQMHQANIFLLSVVLSYIYFSMFPQPRCTLQIKINSHFFIQMMHQTNIFVTMSLCVHMNATIVDEVCLGGAAHLTLRFVKPPP